MTQLMPWTRRARSATLKKTGRACATRLGTTSVALPSLPRKIQDISVQTLLDIMFYNAETSTPASAPGLTRSIAQAVIENPTPGKDAPATSVGTRNDAGISPLSGVYGDQVNSYIIADSNNNTVVVNVTVPGEHILNPGYVAQAIIPGSDSTRIVVVGEGNARIQQGFGAWVGSQAFQNKIERDMRRGIFNSVRSRKW